MEYLVICAVAIIVSALTFLSGFGFGTMLMPAFALFFPIPVAIASTAIVHLANNVFKVGLIGRKANWSVVWRFAAPAVVTAMIGAALLALFGALPPLAAYQLGGQTHHVAVVKLVIGVIIIIFALFDLLPQLSNLTFDPKYLSLGGALSGFFGGLSGFQGALRSAFLIKIGLNKEAFIATGVIAAIMVDIARLLVYGAAFYVSHSVLLSFDMTGLVLAAILAAFTGAIIGKRLLRKVTLKTVQIIVGLMLIAVGSGLATGLL